MSKIKKKHMFSWGLGSLGVAILFNTQTVLLTRYMTDELGIAAGTAGFLLLISKLYDAVTDPLMGWITDRTQTRWGRRRPWIFIGGIGAASSFMYLFNLPSNLSAINGIFIGLIAYSTFYTMFNVPYLSMPAEMSNIPSERATLISWRVRAIGLGQLIGSALAPAMVFWLGGGLGGHASMAMVLGVLAMISITLCSIGTGGARQTIPKEKQKLLTSRSIQLILDNRPFLFLILTKFLQLTATAISLASTAYFFQYWLGKTFDILGIYFAIGSVAIIIVQPFWIRMAKRYPKSELYKIAAIGYSLVSFTWYFTDAGSGMLDIAIRGVIFGVFSGGLLLMGQAMLPDTIQYDYQKTGMRREGIFAGLYTTAEKVSFAIGGAMAGLILQFFGYQSSLSGEVAVQSDETIFGIFILSAIIPALLMLLSCVSLNYYRLKESDLAEE